MRARPLLSNSTMFGSTWLSQKVCCARAAAALVASASKSVSCNFWKREVWAFIRMLKTARQNCRMFGGSSRAKYENSLRREKTIKALWAVCGLRIVELKLARGDLGDAA